VVTCGSCALYTCQMLLLPLKAVILTHSGRFVFDCLMSARPYLYASLKNISLYCIYLGRRVNRMKPHETPSLLYVRILKRCSGTISFSLHTVFLLHAYPNTISSYSEPSYPSWKQRQPGLEDLFHEAEITWSSRHCSFSIQGLLISGRILRYIMQVYNERDGGSFITRYPKTSKDYFSVGSATVPQSSEPVKRPEKTRNGHKKLPEKTRNGQRAGISIPS